MERVALAPDTRGFVLVPSGRAFTPWGFNYDHDTANRLLEDYWAEEWERVERDFHAMRRLGANVVRIHLQVGKFMRGPDEPDPAALAQLRRLLRLAEACGLWLDLTGLACYRKADTPAWYDALDEVGRWAAQSHFWEAVAACGAASPAVFCYDLMNEPVVPGGRRAAGDWLGPPFGGYCYVQFITLDQAGRPRSDIAAAWARMLTAAIRRHDPQRLVTIGLVDWSLERPGLTSGFVPERVAPEVDFLCVHIYPRAGRGDEALATLAGFAVGKPVVIEETFPLSCTSAELLEFIRRSRSYAAGWITFYWGEPEPTADPQTALRDALASGWVRQFSAARPEEIGEQP